MSRSRREIRAEAGTIILGALVDEGGSRYTGAGTISRRPASLSPAPSRRATRPARRAR